MRNDVAQEAEIVEENLKNAIEQYLDKLPKVGKFRERGAKD